MTKYEVHGILGCGYFTLAQTVLKKRHGRANVIVFGYDNWDDYYAMLRQRRSRGRDGQPWGTSPAVYRLGARRTFIGGYSDIA